MSYYTVKACETLMRKYVEKGGTCCTVREGCLGFGTIVCYGKELKTAIIQEHYQNEWSSVHTIRMYKKMPAKYQKLVEETEGDVA